MYIVHFRSHPNSKEKGGDLHKFTDSKMQLNLAKVIICDVILVLRGFSLSHTHTETYPSEGT